ncbi:MAG: ribonuclease HII, partial [Planctomycetota bacterium]
MATLVGIDEAGYGPLLGPLVVSAVSFDMPENLLRANHWDILTKAVSTQKKGLAGRL